MSIDRYDKNYFTKSKLISYNKGTSIVGTYYFEPTITLKGIPNHLVDVKPPFVVEGRSYVAVTHLAHARSQKVRQHFEEHKFYKR